MDYTYWNSTIRVKPNAKRLKGRKRIDTPSTPMKRIGRRTKAWDSVRFQLKKEFAAMGITTCEARLPGCRYDDQLGFAHRMKRRKVVGGELRVVSLLCNPCHAVYEALSPEGMFEAVTKLIRNRKKAA